MKTETNPPAYIPAKDTPFAFSVKLTPGQPDPVFLWRDDHMSKRCTFREYYAQFVSNAVRQRVLCEFTIEELVSTPDQKNLNTLDLNRWDRLSCRPTDPLFCVREEPQGKLLWSLCDVVCIAKEAAKQLIEEHNAQKPPAA